MTNQRLIITASPHLRGADSTPRIMWTVAAGVVPVVATATYFFGPSAVLVIAGATAGAMTTERLLLPKGTLADGSGALTGILLGLTLPAGLPIWMAFLGGAFGIAFGKALFGGLGHNIFNPALLGRAFLQAAFPVAITTWPSPDVPWAQLRGDNFALPFLSPRAPHILTEATPLGGMKFEHTNTPLWDLMIGSTGGSLGETAGLVIIACGIWLAWRRMLNWRIPVAIILTVAALSQALYAANAARYPDALFQIFSGGLLFGAVYMATDPVTSPMTELGRWIFGAGVGLLTVVIRIWGGLPEGVMYAILIMNAFSPAISRATQPRVFGTSRTAKAGP